MLFGQTTPSLVKEIVSKIEALRFRGGRLQCLRLDCCFSFTLVFPLYILKCNNAIADDHMLVFIGIIWLPLRLHLPSRAEQKVQPELIFSSCYKMKQHFLFTSSSVFQHDTVAYYITQFVYKSPMYASICSIFSCCL